MKRKNKENMESQDKRYMLFIFGDFTELENFIEDISYQLVTDEKNITVKKLGAANE